MSPVKTRRIFHSFFFFFFFFCNCLNIRWASFGGKKMQLVAPFSGNYHKLAYFGDVTKNVLAEIWNGIIYLKFDFSNVNLFMFSYFKHNLIEKFFVKYIDMVEVPCQNSFGKAVVERIQLDSAFALTGVKKYLMH